MTTSPPSTAPARGAAAPATWRCRSPTPALAQRLRERMAEVEAALFGHAVSRAPYVTDAAQHLLSAGGKRFRPLLVLLAAEAGAHPESDDVVTAACVVEITHVGSLYHDDVMDEADLRRGADSANSRWDNLVAILTGDFLFAKSSELTARARRRRGAHPGRDLHPPRRGPDPRDRQARPRRGPARALPRRRGRQDRLAHRHLGPLRRPLRRRQRRGRGGPDGVRRDRRHRLPALRRHPRHRLGVRRVRQDPRHRPARGRADAAGADGAGLDRPGRRPPARAARAPTSPTTTCSPRPSACCAPTRRWTEARDYVVARAAEAKALLDVAPRTARSARPSRPSPTSSPSAPPDFQAESAPRRRRLDAALGRGAQAASGGVRRRRRRSGRADGRGGAAPRR